MRIVAGRLGGRPLAAPADLSIRPTSDRVRQAMFDVLMHGPLAAGLQSTRVLDLFAGTGALGLEAISRGAPYALFVEENAEARGLIRQNIEAFGLTGCSKIFRRDASDLGPAGHLGQFGLAFLDPPYGKGLVVRAMAGLLAGGWLAPGAIVVTEERAGAQIVPPAALVPLASRLYGETQVVFLTFNPA